MTVLSKILLCFAGFGKIIWALERVTGPKLVLLVRTWAVIECY
jgi:hypothetical protein